MPAPKLVLYPDVSQPIPEPGAALQLLAELGVIGPAFGLDGRTHYRTGPAFLDHLTFLGCAPAIELDPPATGSDEAARAGRFCHVHLPPPTTKPQVRHRPGQPPRCRACRGEFTAESLANAGEGFVCPGCGRQVPAHGLNWRQAGGYACLFLEIWGIHTGEAVPGEQLLGRLGADWKFFYTED